MIGDPKPKKRAIVAGKAAVLGRNEKGDVVQSRGSNFGGITDQTLREDRAAAAGTGDGSYGSGPAPRVGGATVKASSGSVQGGTKGQVKKSVRIAKRSGASPQAKKAAIRIHRKG